MRKVIAGILAALLLIVATTGAAGAWDTSQGCCQYDGCCRASCCAELTQTYAVTYFEMVDSGFRTNWGSIMYDAVLTTVYVEARTAGDAAASVGKRAGYSAWVARVLP
jgi:hypothetical protein